MSERRTWTLKQDQALKFLKEQRKIKKWSQISENLQLVFGISGRNGKQCRERYHNHLDSSISKVQWTDTQNLLLINLHNDFGNRWASIARSMPGRTDNCVKNHFYSQFRKAFRVINELMRIHFKKSTRTIKTNLIIKIIEIIENYTKKCTKIDRELYQCAQRLKQKLLGYCQQNSKNQDSSIKQELSDLLMNLNIFNSLKKKTKQMSKQKSQINSQSQQASESSFQKLPGPIESLLQQKQSGGNQIVCEQYGGHPCQQFKEDLSLVGISTNQFSNQCMLKQVQYKLIDYSAVDASSNRSFFDAEDFYANQFRSFI